MSAVENFSGSAVKLPIPPPILGFTGEAHRLNGMLNMARGDAAAAAQHFGSSVSIFDMLGDRYRAARAHLELGRAYAMILPDRAGEHLTRALNTFRELGAQLDLSRAEEELRDLARSTPERIQEQSALTQLLTLRLAEAVASRELLVARTGGGHASGNWRAASDNHRARRTSRTAGCDCDGLYARRES